MFGKFIRYFLLVIAIFIILVIGMLTYYAYAHDGYEGLQSKASGPAGCCGGKDCGPVEAHLLSDGSWEVHIVRQANSAGYSISPAIDKWFPVPKDAVLPAELNPKAGPSACFWGGAVKCFMLGRAT